MVEKAFDYNTRQFKALVSNRPTYILAFIKRGLNVIYTDVDTIWLKDPRSFLNDDYDMWVSIDGRVHYCTGFMALKPSSLSINLLKNWKASLVTPDINQIVFNSLVEKSAIRHKHLPREEFPEK
jgi:hypothetical protein